MIFKGLPGRIFGIKRANLGAQFCRYTSQGGGKVKISGNSGEECVGEIENEKLKNIDKTKVGFYLYDKLNSNERAKAGNNDSVVNANSVKDGEKQGKEIKIKCSKEWYEYYGSEADNIKKRLVLIPNFVTPEEHDLLVKGCEKKLKRYNSGSTTQYGQEHFDKRISLYRECTVSDWLWGTRSHYYNRVVRTMESEQQEKYLLLRRKSIREADEKIEGILKRVYDLFPETWSFLPPHILDLHADGNIWAHVDNYNYSGLYVGGLSLLGRSINTFRKVDNPKVRADVYLEPGSLYFFSHELRYDFTHEITKLEDQRVWNGEYVPRERRISIMFRQE